MKYIHIVVALLTALLLITFTSCSPDIEIEEEEEMMIEIEEIETEEKKARKPEPDWADGILTIKAGQFKSMKKLFTALQDARGVGTDYGSSLNTLNSIFFDRTSKKYDPPVMAKKEYTFDVAIVPMKSVGMHQKATMDEIRKEYRKHGYRPLTVEEIFELRLQFLEQADMPFTNDLHGFFALSEKGVSYTFRLFRSSREHVSEAYILYSPLTYFDHNKKAVVKKRYDPIDPIKGYHIQTDTFTPPKGAYRGAQFACAIIE